MFREWIEKKNNEVAKFVGLTLRTNWNEWFPHLRLLEILGFRLLYLLPFTLKPLEAEKLWKWGFLGFISFMGANGIVLGFLSIKIKFLSH
jgi:hypothetical protein